jgi:signal transduction histidine kinase/CheY-like chemotaxis protein/HAMP domain-containing protein
MLISLVAILGLVAVIAVGLGASLQSTQRQLDEAGSTAARVFDKFLSNIESDLVATGGALATARDANEVLRRTLGRQSAVFELILVDPQGKVLAQRRRVGGAEQPTLAEQPWLTTVQKGEVYVGSVDYGEFGVPFMDIAAAVTDEASHFSATLLARVDLTTLWDTAIGLRVGETGYVYITDATGRLLAYRNLQLVQSGTTLENAVGRTPQAIVEGDINIYTGLSGERVLASGVPLGVVPWFAIVEQPVDEALRFFAWLAAVSLVPLLVVGLLVYGIVLFTRRRIVSPLLSLREGVDALRQGDLGRRIDIKTRDELGTLADTFNTMATQLQEVIGTLEQRVADRTRGLQTAAEVARTTTSVLDPDGLLRQTVDLVRDRFDLYYVGLFLLDEEQRFAVLRAGTGEAGQQMIAQGYKLEVGGDSMVGQCVARGEARIVDMGEQVVRFHSPLLPDTRTEIVLPLRSRGRTIGAMTVQSVEETAFDEADRAVMQTMADQVAVAIDNAQLLAQTQAALEETARAQESAEKAKEKAEQAREEAEAANKALEGQMWQTAGQAQLSDRMRGEQDIPALADNIIQQLCHYLKAQVGALYVAEDSTLNLIGSYAYASKNPAKPFEFGEGLVGQAALEKQPIIVTDVPEDCITTRSLVGEIVPRHIMLCPFVYEDQVVGVVEIGTLAEFTPVQVDFIQMAMSNIAIAFTTAQARARINELLAETQQQAEELQAQGEELRVANEELEAQTETLRDSEAKLREKQAVLDRQNRDLKVAQQELEKKAEELALTSKYKSEFLANMSHELRTPLNSLLILARMLADNEEGNLSEDQVQSAQIVYSSGNDLLKLINDILDLSKVETGRMTFHVEPMLLSDLVVAVRSQFSHVAEEKGLELSITLADDVPASIETDQQRVKQIVNNLLSNAFKFTDEGSVSFNIYRPDAGLDLSRSGLEPGEAIAISVRDTGIGIAPEQQKVIFEAFQQADGGTNRQYGGTGLGLAISRELASRLGGHIDVESELGRGSTFTLYLPLVGPAGEGREEGGAEELRVSLLAPSPPSVQSSISPASRPPSPPDDRADLEAGDKILLIIEDDPRFAKVVYDYAHEKAFKCLIAGDGQTGLELVRSYRPAAMILDLNLPDISGWEVLEVLKYDPDTRHIPVHIMSVDEEVLSAYRKGAMGYLTKPVSREGLAESFQRIEQFISGEIKALLLVEDDAKSRRSIKKLLGGSDVEISEADRGEAALDLLRAQRFDCMILDLNLPDMSGFEVLNAMNDDEAIGKCPVIVYTGRDLTSEENVELMKYADSVIVKGVKSPERLLDETALFLHRVVADMPEAKQRTIKRLYTQDTQLEGKTILIVDDDMRSSFALSKLLSDKGMMVKIAQTGEKALELLAETPGMDLVLMDIMMPVMDGYETIGRIRAQREFRTLPILALTAKAMKGDREKCLAAGANDYLPKPVDVDRLLSLLRVWLYQ